MWIFGCCNTLWNYLEVNYVFWIHWTCELLMWLCPCAMMLVITLSWWQQVKLETHTLHDIGKLLNVRVRPLHIGPKDLMQKGTVWHIIPCCPWGEEVNPWVCGWGYTGPRDHMQKRYYITCYPLLLMEGIGKSLRVWVRLGRANRPHSKRGTYHASVFGL